MPDVIAVRTGRKPQARAPIPITHTADTVATRGVEVVYYIRLSPTRVKIGTTKNLVLRCRQLVPNGGRSAVLAYEIGGRALERQRHQQFAHLRTDGCETFRTGRDLIEHIKATRAALEA